VYREEPLPGGVLARVAKSHIRIGTLQYFSATGDTEGLGLLVDHVVARHFAAAAGHDIPALALYEQVVRRQAELVAHWQSTGFIHGVMNTDNMLLSGETIDYGPCAFMDHYDPAAVYSYIDHGGRYAFRNQPAIAHWNLACLGEALLPLLGEEREQAAGLAQEVLDRFPGLYENAYLARMRQKLGLMQEQEGDRALIDDFLELLAENSCDYTLAFRCLGGPSRETGMLHSVFRFPDSFGGWLDRWRRRCSDEAATATELEDRLSAVNPAVIPRNHLVEEAIRRGYEGDFSLFHHLCERFSRPFEWPEDDISLVTPPLPDQVVTQTFCGT
jgi:uncharacterized protein YdiU (UPF0061 family)